MPAFHEVQFPTDISKGSTGGPQRVTDIVTLVSGYEQRNTAQSNSLRTYDAGLGLRSVDDLHDLISFWEARYGQLYGFRWKDWTDYRSCSTAKTPRFDDQAIGTGDGATLTFQLTKTYQSGAYGWARAIKKPVSGSVLVGLNGVNQASGWTVDTTTGIVTFVSAPGGGVSVTAGYEFDVPVRFDAAQLVLSIDAFQHGSVPSVGIREIRV